MNLIGTLAIAMGTSWVSGIRLYAAVATLGLLGRFAHLSLPGELNILTNWWVIGIAAALFVIEFFADKIAYVDSVWDVVQTFIRIPAGAVLAAAAFGDFDRSVQVIALLLGGGLAFSAHATKASARAAINLSPEPASNIVVSLVEDVVALISIVLAYVLPVVLIVLLLIFVVASIFILPKIVGVLRGAVRKVASVFG
ncbi:MAG: DUF4126 domain-containing protein [Pyrinomonadaceae bacterium]